MTYFIDNQVVEGNLNHATWTPGTTTTATVSGTTTYTNVSTAVQIYTGSTAGQIIKLPDATTLLPASTIGWTYKLHNDATVAVTVQDNAGGALFVLAPGQRAEVHNTDVATAAGAWSYQVSNKSALSIKSGSVASGAFAGSPKKSTISFTTAFADTNYSISIEGTDARTFTYESKTAAGFVINANANQALTGNVLWIAVANGENV